MGYIPAEQPKMDRYLGKFWWAAYLRLSNQPDKSSYQLSHFNISSAATVSKKDFAQSHKSSKGSLVTCWASKNELTSPLCKQALNQNKAELILGSVNNIENLETHKKNLKLRKLFQVFGAKRATQIQPSYSEEERSKPKFGDLDTPPGDFYYDSDDRDDLHPLWRRFLIQEEKCGFNVFRPTVDKYKMCGDKNGCIIVRLLKGRIFTIVDCFLLLCLCFYTNVTGGLYVDRHLNNY